MTIRASVELHEDFIECDILQHANRHPDGCCTLTCFLKRSTAGTAPDVRFDRRAA